MNLLSAFLNLNKKRSAPKMFDEHSGSTKIFLPVNYLKYLLYKPSKPFP